MGNQDEGDSQSGVRFTSRDWRGAAFQMVDLRGARFRAVDLRGAWIRAAAFDDTELDGEIGSLTVWGVDVVPLVEAELDRRHPERAALRATTPTELRDGWSGLEAMWASTVDRVAAMPSGTESVSVDGEWSFAETLRHLVLATDAWLGRAILGESQPFHPLGLLFSELAGREDEYGLDAGAAPSYTEVLEARAGRVGMVRDYFASVTDDELGAKRADPWGSEWEPSVLDCLRVICNEEWHHHRYAVRDLDAMERGSGR